MAINFHTDTFDNIVLPEIFKGLINIKDLKNDPFKMGKRYKHLLKAAIKMTIML